MRFELSGRRRRGEGIEDAPEDIKFDLSGRRRRGEGFEDAPGDLKFELSGRRRRRGEPGAEMIESSDEKCDREEDFEVDAPDDLKFDCRGEPGADTVSSSDEKSDRGEEDFVLASVSRYETGCSSFLSYSARLRGSESIENAVLS